MASYKLCLQFAPKARSDYAACLKASLGGKVLSSSQVPVANLADYQSHKAHYPSQTFFMSSQSQVRCRSSHRSRTLGQHHLQPLRTNTSPRRIPYAQQMHSFLDGLSLFFYKWYAATSDGVIHCTGRIQGRGWERPLSRALLLLVVIPCLSLRVNCPLSYLREQY